MRGVGRKSEATQTKILEAARDEFLTFGFNGASMSKIGARAGVTKALLFHYFQSKEELWRNVKDSILPTATVDKATSMTAKSFRDFLEQVFDLRFALYAANPSLVKMMLWQRVEADSSNIEGTARLPSHLWEGSLTEFQKKGEIGVQLSPKEILNLVFSQSSLPFLEGWNWVKDKDMLKKYKGEVIQMLLNLTAKC